MCSRSAVTATGTALAEVLELARGGTGNILTWKCIAAPAFGGQFDKDDMEH